MDSRRSSDNESVHNKVPHSITSALVSAVLEWLLMFMIFVDACVAYIVTKFARHYRLQTPCLLCSRLDHALGNERAGFYWDLMCHEHKSKISSLVLGQLHNSLVDDDDAPSSNNHTHGKDLVKEFAEKSSRLDKLRSKDADPLPYVEYSQIKDTSDTESEGFSDTERDGALIHEVKTSFQESVTNKFVSAELDPLIKPSLSEFEKPTYSNHNVESDSPLGHGLEELDWQKSGHSKDAIQSSELKDCSYVCPPNTDGNHSGDSKETEDASSIIEAEKEIRVECRETSNVGIDSTGTDELWKEVKTEGQENYKAGSDSIPPNEIQMDLKSNRTETSTQVTGSLELGDAYKLALGTRGRQLSGRLEQQRSITDRVSEDLKLLLSQISNVRGLDLPINDMSPKVSANNEDFKVVDAFGALGTQSFQRRISLERNESNLSLDGNSLGEVEGESDLDRLKRQVEHDRNILATLYKELEEERNASAVAANQAMAMITRLQEEKAAFHMEALQCVRMMEEQAEYDGEALQKAYLLLAEKEKQIENFQFDLEFYRNRSGDVPSSRNFFEQGLDYESDELKEQILEANCWKNNTTALGDSDSNKHEIVKTIDGAPKMFDGEIGTLQMSFNQFEDEKQYILECLKKMEEKLFVFTKHEVYSDMIAESSSSEESLEACASDQPEFVGISKENGGTEKDHLKRDKFMPTDISGYENSVHEIEESGKSRPDQYVNKDVELSALRHELSVINNRLQAVVAEQSVIESSIKALEKGSEGYEFIREIAARLHELHSAHVMKRKEDST